LLKPFSIVAALWVLGALGCGAEDRGLRRDLEAMRAEMQTMRRENGELAKRVEVLSARLDSLAARSSRKPSSECAGPTGPCASPGLVAAPVTTPAGKASPMSGPDSSAIVPPNLTVVRIEPPRKGTREGMHRTRRAPPSIPTAVPLSEPDREVLDSLAAPRRDLSAEAQADLDAAHAMSGLAAARALEAFTSHYPHHPSADNALVEAALLRADTGEPDAACALYARCVDEYPAGDAMPEALERLGECHVRRGRMEQARRLFGRVVNDYPESSAAKRAAERLAEGTGGGAARAAPSRQGAVQ
jgi:TolA-binding protein